VLTAEEEWEETTLHTLCDLGARSRRVDVAEQIVDRRFRVAGNVNAELNADGKTRTEDELARRCRTLDVPVLVVAGEEDPRPPFAVDSLVAALPDAERVVLSGVGHLPWLEDPEALRTVLRGFLSRVVVR
jgi:proline iminopeptidase